jgi:hypothetical protein
MYCEEVHPGSPAILRRRMLELSEARSWPEARLEWRLIAIRISPTFEECLCTHYPIVEICLLRNQRNSKMVEVGNVCVKKFMGINSHKIFACLRRIKKDPLKALNPDTIELFFSEGSIGRWERGFLLDTWRRRILSDKQEKIRLKINRRIIRRVLRGDHL